MSKTIVVVGFGPGISTGVAEKFGAEGFNVALVGRTQSRLDAGVAALKEKGVSAAAFTADAGDPVSIVEAIGKVRAQFGPITVLQWNAYGGFEAGDLSTAGTAAVRGIFDVAIVGLLAAIQAVVPDVKGTKTGAILITNGAFADLDPQVDGFAIANNAMGVALGNAAKHKLVGLLALQLKPQDIYVGEVMIAGSIKGTAWAGENAIDPATVGNKFFELYQGRGEVYARIS
jgi:NAD(P)-dependent dehydrogenase (short-subunit alcohol dehydrogenase family)